MIFYDMMQGIEREKDEIICKLLYFASNFASVEKMWNFAEKILFVIFC